MWRILGFMLLGWGLRFKAGHVVMKRDFALVADALAKTCSNVDVWQGGFEWQAIAHLTVTY